MRFGKSSIIGVAAIVAAGLAAYMYFASQLVALNGMKSALEQRDHEAFSAYIDFDKLRASLREELAAQAAINAAESDNPFEQMGIAAGAAIADPLIDRLLWKPFKRRGYRTIRIRHLQAGHQRGGELRF